MARIVALDFGVLKALTVFLVLCPFTMQSHIFFTDGMEWKIVSAPVILPPPGECLSIYRLEGDSVCDGFRWFKMYYTVDANPESRRFAGMVRTEGDKVYYKDKYDTGLLYDFGLKPGEICFTGALAEDSDRPGYKCYIKCAKREKREDYGGWECMEVEAYSEPECVNDGWYHGIWFDGLGGSGGVHENNRLLWEGGWSQLVQASVNGNVIFQMDDSYFNTPADNSIINLEGHTLDITNKRRVVPVRVYTGDGVLIYDEIVKHACISLPGDGGYVIKIGTLKPVRLAAGDGAAR